MAVARETMTDEQRKSVALEYLKAFDNAGVTSNGGSILDLFAEDAQVYFPKWGIATGKEEIGRCFGDVGAKIQAIKHDYSHFNWVMSGTDTGTSWAWALYAGSGALVAFLFVHRLVLAMGQRRPGQGAIRTRESRTPPLVDRSSTPAA